MGCKGGAEIVSRFGKRAQKLGLVQIVVEVSEIRGGFLNTCRSEPVFGWRCCSVLGDYGEGLFIRTACYT